MESPRMGLLRKAVFMSAVSVHGMNGWGWRLDALRGELNFLGIDGRRIFLKRDGQPKKEVKTRPGKPGKGGQP